MRIIIASADNVWPSLECLSEVGIPYAVRNDGAVIITLNARKFIVGQNKDIKPEKQGEWPNNDPSLAYFVVTKHLIIASGNLKPSDGKNFECKGPFRVFSNDPIATYDYILAGQVDLSEKDALNGYMLDISSKGANTK